MDLHGLAATDPDVNQTSLVIVNGAAEDQAAQNWEARANPNYDRIRNDHLVPQGLSERRVQVIWLKVSNAQSLATLPEEISDAHLLLSRMGIISRTLLNRYPNLEQVFVSSRIYGGFSTGALNGEPYAYETGFAVKWLVESQIIKVDNPLFRNDFTGDLDYDTVAPWLAWGPYLWADGENPTGGAMDWTEQDFESDGVQPSQVGEEKVGRLLLEFFKTSPHTACWFTTAGVCG